jgi:hypothetical protein
MVSEMRGSFAGALLVALCACGGGDDDDGPRALDTQEVYQDFFWEYCLPLAEVLTALAEDAGVGAAPGNAIECPGGGTATYDPDTSVAALSDCGGAGSTVNGTVIVMFQSTTSATISGGTLSIDGAFAGTATIRQGLMGWSIPVEDATTYWELRITLDGADVCIWSGAETGPCPTF